MAPATPTRIRPTGAPVAQSSIAGSPGAIESGHLLRAVSTFGLNAGFREAVAMDLDALEAEWVREQALGAETELLDACGLS